MSLILSMGREGNAGRALSAHRFFIRFAGAAVNAFVWVFVFEYFAGISDFSFALAQTALIYALSQVVIVLATPAMIRLVRGGMQRGVVYGTLLGASAFIALGALFTGALSPQTGFLAFAVLLGLFRATYRVPYAVERAVAAPHTSIPVEILVALAPLIAGFWLSQGAALSAAVAALFFVAAVCTLVALLPLYNVPDVLENFSWGYRETFSELFGAPNRKVLLAALFAGAEASALFLFWPILVFVIAGQSYLLLGLVFSFTLVTILASRFIMRWLFATLGVEDSTTIAVVLVASGWIVRPFIVTPFAAFLTDSYGYSTPAPSRDFDAVTREQHSDGGVFVDELTALKEMGSAFGALALSLIAAILSPVVSFGGLFIIVFVIAAMVASFSVVFARRAKRFVY